MNLYIPASLKRQFLAFSGLHNSYIHIVPLNLTIYTGYEEFRHYFYRHGLSMPSVVTVALMAIYVGINSGYSEIDLYGVDHTFFDSLNRKMMQSLKGESEKEKVTKWEKKSDTPQSWN